MRSIIGASRNGNAKTGTVAGTTGRGTLGGTLAACGWDRTDGREYASQEGANLQQPPRDDYPYRSYPYMTRDCRANDGDWYVGWYDEGS